MDNNGCEHCEALFVRKRNRMRQLKNSEKEKMTRENVHRLQNRFISTDQQATEWLGQTWDQ